MGASTNETLTAYAETKRMYEWLRDPRCTARSTRAIRRRIQRGLSPEEALAPKPRASSGAKYLAFGELKSLYEWAADPRCKVSRNCLFARLKKGESAESAMERSTDMSEIVHDAARKYPAFGEMKSLPDWSQDVRCKVHYHTLCKRVNVGLAVAEAMKGGPHVRPNVRKKLTAFGETKSVREWSEDVRCPVCFEVLNQRLLAGIPAEEAITARKRYNYDLFLAFGEWKLLADWRRDPRCVVTFQALYKRVHAGMALEAAMTTPMVRTMDHHKVWPPVTAFGETKSVMEWARDPRCAVSEPTLRKRLAAGEDPESAITRSSHYGLRRIWDEKRVPIYDTEPKLDQSAFESMKALDAKKMPKPLAAPGESYNSDRR